MTETPTTITLVRHGHVYNPTDLIYGRLPGFRLSGTGRRQAEAAATYLQHVDVNAIYASPQLRARETAEIVQRYHPELTISISPLIDEIHCYFEGHPSKEVEARGWDLYTGIEGDYEIPEQIAERGARFIAATREAHLGRHIAAVTHGDVIAFTILHAVHARVDVSQKRTLDEYGITDLYPATASLTTLTYRTSDPDEVPTLAYVRPYDDDLVLTALS